MRRTLRWLAFAVAIVVAVAVADQFTAWYGAVPTPILSDAEIRSILVDRIDKYKQTVGIAVGIIEPQGRRVISYGQLNQGDPRVLDGDTVFEIGSISKVFTSLLLADMVKRGEVALDDPVAKYLPPGVKVPERKGRQITLVDLATHMSGLPREAPNFKPNWEDWEGGYSERSLYEFLGSYQLIDDIGSNNDYSNVGMSLLGIALARRAGMDYDALVRVRICEPLGLGSTGVSLTPDMAARLAVGHGYRLSPAPNMNLHVFEGAGGLRSTVNDLLTLLGAQLGYQQTPLSPAMALTIDVDLSTMPPVIRIFLRDRQHLGWLEAKKIIWHDGATLGYRSFIGFDPKIRRGVVVLSNGSTHGGGIGPGVNDIGRHLLDPKMPLLGIKELQPAKEHREVSVKADVLERYVGRYEVSSDDWVVITRVGDHLLVDGNGDPNVPYYPENDETFFSKILEGQIVSKTDQAGRVTELVWSTYGASKRYKRSEDGR
jgi:serine-type D-Ala-D-Ala carboxypeptidase/endopeptidase